MEYQEICVPLKDKFFTTYVLFYALGTVTLVPFNFFTTATDMYKFRDPESNLSYSTENRTGLQAEFTADYTIVSNVSNAVFIILTILWIRRLTILVRTIMALCGTIAIFVCTCIFVKLDTDSWQTGFMVVTLLTGFFLTGFCGIFLVTLFEMAPKFPPSYLAVIFSGQAICGILSALAQIVSLSVDADPAVNGLVYFLSGLSFVVLTLVGFSWSLRTSHFFKHHFWKEIAAEKFEVSKEKILTILHKVKFYLLAMTITCGSTIMVQPSVTSLVLSVDKNNGNNWNDVYFAPVITFLVYCTSDYFGREFAMLLKKHSQGLVLLSAACVRVVFVPLLMLCNAQPRDHLPVVFDEDYAYIIFIIIIASTNGFLMNLCIIRVSHIPTDDEKPLAMFFIMIFIIVSSMICAFVGNGLVQAL
ncbi:hypothetical protein Zmor_026238 [Zophobas morio]|uniref:Equilibrative nucleoside transporter 3 n=1 Tax=Zophobas morio TaxID=2755281 RepID=A0AA38HTQ5_9CUCU|nr:hypothetical protein Zmor_026238 [Zophobas morio]